MGPGLSSLDARLGLASAWTSSIIWVALAIGAVGGFANLAQRRLTVPSV